MTKVPWHCWLIKVLECLCVVAIVWGLGVGIARWGEGRETLAALMAASAAGGILSNYLDRVLCGAWASIHRLFASRAQSIDQKAVPLPLHDARIEALLTLLLVTLHRHSLATHAANKQPGKRMVAKRLTKA